MWPSPLNIFHLPSIMFSLMPSFLKQRSVHLRNDQVPNGRSDPLDGVHFSRYIFQLFGMIEEIARVGPCPGGLFCFRPPVLLRRSSIERAERCEAIDSQEPPLRTCCILHRLCANRRKSCDLIPAAAWVKTLVVSIIKAGFFKLFRRAAMRVFIRKALRGIKRGCQPSESQRRHNESYMRQYTNPTVQSEKVAGLRHTV